MAECPEWPAFVAWRNGLSWSDQAEVEAGLAMLLRRGPRYNTPRLADGVYVMYVGRLSRTFWVLVGDPTPDKRRLWSLAWGTNPAKSITARVIAEATEKLLKWREANK
jgi:hypothetical protein